MKKRVDIKKIFLKIIFFIFRRVILLFLGFLPSFLFIALFIQYGPPFSNYINFLLNFKESWIAWLSAIVIIFLLFSISKGIRTFKEMRKSRKKKKKWIIISLSMIFIVGLIIWQLYLYVGFILGNDILVKVSSDKDNFFFTNSTEEPVNFKISVTMNPFCVAECEYEFFDLSNGNVIESGTFDIASLLSSTKTYLLSKSDVDLGSQVLNQFKVSCKSKKTPLCFTKEKEQKRTILITLNNIFSDEERTLLNNYKDKIIFLRQISYLSGNAFNELKLNLNSVNDSFSTEKYPLSLLEKRFSELNDFYDILQRLWRLQELDSLKVQVPLWEEETLDFYNLVGEYNKNLSEDFSLYNNLSEKIRISKQILSGVKSKALPEYLCFGLNETILKFNNAIFDFKYDSRLLIKQKIVDEIYSEVLILSELVNGNSGESLCEVVNVTEINFDKLHYFPLSESIPEVILDEPLFSCCYLGKCKKCCDESCSNKYYPIIFLHGHSLNGALSADYSFDSFMEIKNNLTEEGYIDAGEFFISKEEGDGFWGRINVPIMVTASYFFDAYKTASGDTVTVSSKLEGVDTYAIRLRQIINTIKEKTGKDKVIIVAHSMGGIVTRRYLQVFGEEYIEKVILVTVPNHGISDKVRSYCAVFGAETACNDMNKESILMNQLNNVKEEFPKLYNIIGIGCNMGDETGDGIVKNSSQFLDSAKNYYVNGSCDEFDFEFFHETILYPNVYPEAYKIIKKLL